MKFSADGPDIPTDLIDASIRGEVVFLCGAGVSLPAGLPNFQKLTLNVFNRLGLSMEGAEQFAFDQKRYEEVFGSLSRRVADRKSIYSAVAAELDADKAIDISTHFTILRLSRDSDGKPATVTTNFDTLFERSWNDATQEDVRDKSFASAQVPAPAGPRFEGIIHLHGRLADKKLSLEGSDLVLTSADYGDAYLRSGWAARFLYDLARTRIIVLAGYSASDAPVRYILNILEADRERFPDLKRIYVLDSCAGSDPARAADAWDAVAVEPIIFSIDFPSFWRDMSAWADLVELPGQWRKSKLETFAARPFDELAEWEKAQARWILAHPDALSLLGQLDFPPQWVEYLRVQNLIKVDSGSDRSLCLWAARHLALPDAFVEVLKSISMIGLHATEIIARALDSNDREATPAYIEKAWRLLIGVIRQPTSQRPWMHYGAFGRIRSKCATGDDLRETVQIFTPRLSIKPQYSFYTHVGEAPRLSSICRVEFETPRNPTLAEFLQVLPSDSPDLWTLLRLADGALIEALTLSRGADRADTVATYGIPSISDHQQNEHHRGFLPIVRLCAELWLRLLHLEPAQAAAVAETWKHGAFAVTTRMWLFTLHKDPNASHNSIVEALLSLSAKDFWAHRKEVMELLCDRTSDASARLCSRLATRIIDGPVLNEEIEDAERPKDAYRWVYLAAFQRRRQQLPPRARKVWRQINDQRSWHDRRLREADFFWMWSQGVRDGPIGDPAPIAEAPVERRVEVAADLEREDWLNQADAWRVYCQGDPEGALESLIATGEVFADAPRWRDLLWTIPTVGSRTDAEKARGRFLTEQAISVLRTTPKEQMVEVTHPLADLFAYASIVEACLPRDTWDWLWSCAETHEREVGVPAEGEDAGYELISQAINAASGKLARGIVGRLGPSWRTLSDDERELAAARFKSVLSSETNAGAMARAVVIEFVGWLNDALPDLVDQAVLPALTANDTEAFALRSLLVGISHGHTPDLRMKLREPILKGVQEFTGSGPAAENTACRFLAIVADDLSHPMGDPGMARATLTASSANVRAATAEVLADWLSREQYPEAAWRQTYSAIFRSVWPADKRALTRQASVSLATFALAAGEAFPDALNMVLPYIVPLDEEWPPLHFATRNEFQATVEAHPRETLAMLWQLLKPAKRGQSYDLATVLDRITTSDPSLVRDRRFQLLETRALRMR